MQSFCSARSDYVRNIIPLEIHHAWALARREEEPVPLRESLTCFTDIWRKTAHYDGKTSPLDDDFASPKWDKMLGELVALFDEHASEETSDGTEKACFEYLWPLLEPRIEVDAVPPRKGTDRPYGCWTYYVRQEVQVSIHIANVYRPESPFENVDAFAGDLLRLIEDAVAEHSQVTTLFCGSWLNNLPPFQAIFPPAWRENLNGPVWLNGTNGIWGQYMDRRGAFHQRHGAHLREAGRHRYPLIHSHCPLEEAMAHLRRRDFGKG